MTQTTQQQLALAELARRNFDDFVRYTFPNFKENWHHKVLMEALDGALKFKKKYRHTIVVTPPRHGKSELVSRRAPAFAIGRHPELEIIQATYSDDLAQKMGRDVGNIITSTEYTELFPDFCYGDKNTHTEKSTPQGGTYKATGVGGGVTGRGANIIIIDDPIKNREEAEQQSTRDKIWDWFQDDLMTRIEYPYSVIITMTRWHRDDLVGRLVAKEPDKWNVIHLPLIADYENYDEPWPDYDPRSMGDVLWPQVRIKGRLNIPGAEIPTDDDLSEEIKEDFETKVESNPYGAYSLDQGRPVKKEGNLFKRDWFNFYDAPPSMMGKYCVSQVISIDANFRKTETGSAAALVVMGMRKDGNMCILDGEWASMDFVELKAAALKMAHKWPDASFLIEGKGNGDALLASLRDEHTVICFEPGNNSKEARAHKMADVAESGAIYLPVSAPWTEELMTIICDFPGGAIDDPIDCISQVCIKWDRRTRPLEHLRRIVGKTKDTL